MHILGIGDNWKGYFGFAGGKCCINQSVLQLFTLINAGENKQINGESQSADPQQTGTKKLKLCRMDRSDMEQHLQCKQYQKKISSR